MNPHCLGDIGAFVIRWSNKIFFTCFSITLDAAGSIDIGLYPEVIFLSLPGLGIGVILAVFHSCGTLPVESDKLRRLESDNAVLQAVCFNIFTDTPSHPVDLLVSRAVNSSYTELVRNFLLFYTKICRTLNAEPGFQ